ncbi:MAG: GMC family oxidoreductase, partial [Myxococcales bacterium]|nr:GMC family oxidoreductase [Myxococcales bacterium]
MIQDSSELSTGAVLKADVCIVGGGPAGISIARALAGSGKKVLLLESGGRDVEGASQALAGATQDVGYDRLSSNRLRRLGGTTGHWAGQSIPLDPIDLRARDWVPGSGWPIAYREVERWVRADVDACGLGAEPFTWEAWSGAVRLPDALPFSDRIVVQPLRFSTPPRDFGKHFGAELRAKEDVQVVLHASVTHLETGKEG